MNAKRPLEDCDSDDIKRQKLDITEADNEKETLFFTPEDSAAFVNAVQTSDLTKMTNLLLKLKQHLITKERVLNFLETDRQLEKDKQCYPAIITFLLNQGNAKFHVTITSEQHATQSDIALREAISLLANACHLSISAFVEIRKKENSLCLLYEHFLKASTQLVSPILKATLLRLIGNLCELKETAVLFAVKRSLLDPIVLSLETNDRAVTEQALRLLRLLAKHKQFSRNLLRSEACFHIAKFLVTRQKQQQHIFWNRPDILQTLQNLLRYHPFSVGKQLARCSEFMDFSLNFLLEYPQIEPEKAEPLQKHWLEFILRSTELSNDMCLIFGRLAVQKILDQDRIKLISDIHCRFLCCFAQDLQFRIWLMENGGLALILDRLAPIELDDNATNDERMAHLRFQSKILDSLRFASYDDTLAFIIRHPNFLPIFLHNNERFLNKTPKCQVKLLEPEDVRPRLPSSLDIHLDEEQQNIDNQQEQQPLCKDFSMQTHSSSFFNHSPSTSPPRSSFYSWSPSTSPPSTSQCGPPSPYMFSSQESSSFCASPVGSPPRFVLDELIAQDEHRQANKSPEIRGAAPEELEPDDPTAIGTFTMNQSGSVIENQSVNEEMELRKKIVQNTLLLISQFCYQDERRNTILLKKEILDAMVRHISEAPEMNNSLKSALNRLAKHLTGMQLLLDMGFHQIVITRLIRRPCLLARYARTCVRCDIRREHGRSLLLDHALLVDSSMGEYILLTQQIEAAAKLADPREAEFMHFRTLITALILIRSKQLAPRFYQNFRPVDALLDSLGKFLREIANTGEALDENTDKGQLCCNIIVAFASLLVGPSSQWFSRFPAIQMPANDGIGKCILEELPEQVEGTLKFRNNQGELLVEVPKRELCTGNEYFAGMFGSEFIERLQRRDEFTFDAEQEICTEEEFVKFLHFSIGCPLSSDCVRVGDGECCSALLYLADKYLCTRLLDHLLNTGIAARFVTGQSLRLFLPLVLSIPTIADRGGLKDACMLVLLRYSTNTELLATLNHIAIECGEQTICAFLALLHEFMSSVTDARNIILPWHNFYKHF